MRIKSEKLSLLYNHLITYPTPLNISYFWSFGVLSAFCLGVQIISGVFLAMFYTPHIDLAFSSVEYIMREVHNGWFIRYLHANGASMFFIVVYIHIFRGLYYNSYVKPRAELWCSGIIIFLLMMGTAFMGYVLPWGQMSFWGVTVITNLVTAIPLVGTPIVEWLWGGFSVNNATLNRFFSLHYLFPFIIVGSVLLHIALLHKDGSNNPLGVDSKINRIPFFPYFYVKDLFSVLLFGIVFSFFLFYFPNFLGHATNYIPANPLVTPAHIVPEWYFLPFYAILRSIPNKLGGVLAMFGAIVILMLLPFINFTDIRSPLFRVFYRLFFWLILVDFIILGWIGQKIVEEPFVTIGQTATFFYFFSILVLVPLISYVEKNVLSILYLKYTGNKGIAQ